MLIIGQQSAYTGSLMKIELVKWSVRNWWSAAEREGKIPNGVETSVKPTLCRLFFREKTKTCKGQEQFGRVRFQRLSPAGQYVYFLGVQLYL